MDSKNEQELTFAEKEANILRKRLNLLALSMDAILTTKQKTKIFNLVQSLEKIDSIEHATMRVKKTDALLSIVPKVYTVLEIGEIFENEDRKLAQS